MQCKLCACKKAACPVVGSILYRKDERRPFLQKWSSKVSGSTNWEDADLWETTWHHLVRKKRQNKHKIIEMIFSGNTFCRSDLARCLTRLTTVSPLLCDSTTTWHHHHHHHRHHCDTKPIIIIMIIIMIPIRLKAPIIPIVISDIQWSRSRSGDIERTRSIPRRERCLWHSWHLMFMAFWQTKEGKIEPHRPLYDNKMTQPSILIPRLTQVSIFVEEDRNGRSPLF